MLINLLHLFLLLIILYYFIMSNFSGFSLNGMSNTSRKNQMKQLHQRQERERQERDRQERERQERDRQERDRQERERQERERQERERQERERQERERLKRIIEYKPSMNQVNCLTSIIFSITNSTIWPISLSGKNDSGSVNASINTKDPAYKWIGSLENNSYIIDINDTTTNPATVIGGGLSCGMSAGIDGTRGWCDPANKYESSIVMSCTISGGSLGTVTYTDQTSGGTSWMNWSKDIGRFTNVDIVYTQPIVPGPPTPPGPGPIPPWTPTVNLKAIYYHQQWSCYGASAWPTSQPNGTNIATTTGRNFLISDIPDDVFDLSYAFWYVDEKGNIQSADDWADHDNTLVNQNGSSSGGAYFPWTPDDPSNKPPPCQPPNLFSKGNQYPAWRPTSVKGNFGQLLVLNSARIQRGVQPLNTSLTIGGWSYSTYFSSAVNDANRANFVSSCIHALSLWGDIFNGINFDWEYISDNGINYGNAGGNQFYDGGPWAPANQCSIDDVINFGKFLSELRTAINNDNFLKGQNIKIGIPVTPAPEKAQFDVNFLAGLVDEIHVMTYDYHSGSFPGDTQSGFHSNPLSIINKNNYPSPVYSTLDSIEYYLGLSGKSPGRPPGESIPKVLPSKLFLGIAFYTRGYSETLGPYTPASSKNVPPNISAPYDPLTQDKGVIPYWQVVTLPQTVIGSQILNDADTAAAYWISKDANQLFLSFDNPTSIDAKFASIVAKYKIGGILAWDNSSDIRGRDAKNESLDGSLTHCISRNIREQNETNRNNAIYMVSYANVVYPTNVAKKSMIPVSGVHMKKPSYALALALNPPCQDNPDKDKDPLINDIVLDVPKESTESMLERFEKMGRP